MTYLKIVCEKPLPTAVRQMGFNILFEVCSLVIAPDRIAYYCIFGRRQK